MILEHIDNLIEEIDVIHKLTVWDNIKIWVYEKSPTWPFTDSKMMGQSEEYILRFSKNAMGRFKEVQEMVPDKEQLYFLMKSLDVNRKEAVNLSLILEKKNSTAFHEAISRILQKKADADPAYFANMANVSRKYFEKISSGQMIDASSSVIGRKINGLVRFMETNDNSYLMAAAFTVLLVLLLSVYTLGKLSKSKEKK
jgi:hypothetical protein